MNKARGDWGVERTLREALYFNKTVPALITVGLFVAGQGYSIYEELNAGASAVGLAVLSSAVSVLVSIGVFCSANDEYRKLRHGIFLHAELIFTFFLALVFAVWAVASAALHFAIAYRVLISAFYLVELVRFLVNDGSGKHDDYTDERRIIVEDSQKAARSAMGQEP